MARNSRYPDSVHPGIPKLTNPPREWSQTSFGELFNVITRPHKPVDENTYSLVTVKRNRGGVTKRYELKGKDILVKTQFYVEAGDFIISKRQIVHGACGIIPLDLSESLVSNEYLVLHPNEKLDIDFINYFTQTLYFQQTCFHSSIGVDVEKMIFKEKWWFKYKINLPPLSEQRKIVEALKSWDLLIKRFEDLILLKELQKKGLMQELLTGKKRLPAFSKNSSFSGKFPEDWKIRKIKDFCSCYSGGTPQTGVSEYYDGNISWITSSDLNQKRISSVSGRISQLGLDKSSAKEVKKGTLLYALYGATAGVCSITEIDATINQAILAINPKNSSTLFLLYYLRHNKDKITQKYTQGGQPNLSGTIIKELSIPLPSPAEQSAIANILDLADKEIEKIHSMKDKLSIQKNGLLQKLLAGEIRVKT